MVKRLRPDVTLMDIRMPLLDGISATRELQSAGVTTKILMLTTFDLDEYVFEALRAGASGFILKDAPAEDLAAAIRVVASGKLPPGTRSDTARHRCVRPHRPIAHWVWGPKVGAAHCS
jgi:DNA-binding NarL/FixJ family response regulator